MANPNWAQVSVEFRDKLKSGEIVNATIEELGQYLLCLPHISNPDVPESVKSDYSVLVHQLIQSQTTKDLAKEQLQAAKSSAGASRLSDERSRKIARGALAVSIISAGASILFGLFTAFRKPSTIINTPVPMVMVSTNVVTVTNQIKVP